MEDQSVAVESNRCISDSHDSFAESSWPATPRATDEREAGYEQAASKRCLLCRVVVCCNHMHMLRIGTCRRGWKPDRTGNK